MDIKLPAIKSIEETLETELDFNFTINEHKINTLGEFYDEIKKPFDDRGRQIFYRGERVNDPKRVLTPTMLRNKDDILKNGEAYVEIDYNYLINYYREKGDYLNFYTYVFGNASKYRLFELCSFSQHYLDRSPFVDFTKSLYVALSFALKQRQVFNDDIVIYAVEINDSESYTEDLVTAECWLHDYRVTVFNTPNKIAWQPVENRAMKSRQVLELINNKSIKTSPTAKFIDIPTNDLIKFQQGVFLLLTDFSMFFNAYLTKNIREDFKLVKFVISKDICKDLVELIDKEAPWYQYDSVYDISKAIKKF